MELVVQTHGDCSIGIEPIEVVFKINLQLAEPEDHDEREFIRMEITALLETISDDKVKFAIYEDECEQCRKLKSECLCQK